MNWLGHAYLATGDAPERVGNLLADMVKGEARSQLPTAFLPGIQRHQQIDAFTDRHPLVWQSRRRLPDEYRRYAGILVDVFYDHVLAREWANVHHQPLEQFLGQFYADVEATLPLLPREVRVGLERMVSIDLLGSYQHVGGIGYALARLEERLSRRRPLPVSLVATTDILVAEYEGFAADFSRFLPALRADLEQ